MIRLLVEAIVVGIGTVIVGFIVSKIVSYFASKKLPDVCKEWNKHHVMEICLFLTGFSLHLLCEAIGLNKWYCKNSYACK